jgi:chorismate dehydratase
LRIGCVKYLNARPLIHGWEGEVVLDHPAALSQKLAAGELDVALVSSFEFLRNPIYRIADDLSISSHGAVYSVIVAHRGDLAQVRDIVLDPASQTSIALLRWLCVQRGLKAQFVAGGVSADAFSGPAKTPADKGWLLIGDQAIRFRRRHPEFSFWDLGESWQKATGLPFVFALWLIRPEIPKAAVIAARLRARRDQNLATLDELTAAEKDFDPEFCCRYYRENLRFSFGEQEKQGLREFAKACAKLDLIPKRELKLELV